jgi:uncharacterized caspase-like protein
MRALLLLRGLGLASALVAGAVANAEAQLAPSAPSADRYDESRWALIIGVSTYSQSSNGALSDLHGPANDARRLSDALIKRGRFNPRHVAVVADGTPFPPTRDVILAQLARVTEGVEPNGLLLVFFAGHGIASESEAYLLPSNTIGADPHSSLFQSTAIPVSLIRRAIEERKTRQVVLLLDACRNNPTARGTRSMALADNPHAMREAFTWSNTVTIFATQPGHVAFEKGGDTSVGYFADALADGLMGQAANAAGEITIGTLMDYLPDEVDSRVRRDMPRQSQRPQLLADTGRKIVLAYGRQGQPVDDGPPPLPASLRLRLPSQALTSARLTVTNNFFTLRREELLHPIPVDPGQQFLEVKIPGYQDWSREVDVRSATSVDVHLQPNRSPVLASLAAVGVGAGAIGAGLAFGAHARTLSKQVEPLNHKCSRETPCEYKGELRDKDQAGRRAQDLSRIFLVAGSLVAVAGAGAAGYFYWSRPPLAPETAGVSFTPTRAGAQVSLRHPW